MNTHSSIPLPKVHPTSSDAFSLIADWWRERIERWRRARERAAHERLIDGLDDATLRDIGMARSEAASYWVESEGLASATRLRVLRDPGTGAWR